jgi:hypothetical protein
MISIVVGEMFDKMVVIFMLKMQKLIKMIDIGLSLL